MSWPGVARIKSTRNGLSYRSPFFLLHWKLFQKQMQLNKQSPSTFKRIPGNCPWSRLSWIRKQRSTGWSVSAVAITLTPIRWFTNILSSNNFQILSKIFTPCIHVVLRKPDSSHTALAFMAKITAPYDTWSRRYKVTLHQHSFFNLYPTICSKIREEPGHGFVDSASLPNRDTTGEWPSPSKTSKLQKHDLYRHCVGTHSRDHCLESLISEQILEIIQKADAIQLCHSLEATLHTYCSVF